MRNHAGERPNSWRKLILAARLAALAVPLLAIALTASVWAQAPAATSPVPPLASAPAAAVPQWQVDAGGKAEFDVVSLKPNKSGAFPSGDRPYSNVPLGPQDMYSPTGGLLTATNMPLVQYMIFAYKLTPNQTESVTSQLPKWASTSRYDIQARAAGNPTKDQFRLMMQALLADRFKLAIHYETKQVPVMDLVLDKPGKLGPHIQPHPADDSACSTAPPAPNTAPGPLPTVAGGFPEICGALVGWLTTDPPGRVRAGARNMGPAMIATSFSFSQLIGTDRPVIDKTGLTGKYDFTIEFTPEVNGPPPPGSTFQPDPNGPTFLEALKEQLGLKLVKDTGPVDVIVVDHVEQPSEN